MAHALLNLLVLAEMSSKYKTIFGPGLQKEFPYLKLMASEDPSFEVAEFSRTLTSKISL